MNDNELFTLCKQVYEKTGWKEPKNLQLYRPMTVHKNDSNQEWEIVHNIWSDDTPFDEYDYIPLYTSDYLLEKLPPRIRHRYWFMLTPMDAGTPTWEANYRRFSDDSSIFESVYGSSVLITVLKLTLALAEAGELK
jgi:hypothetical protein